MKCLSGKQPFWWAILYAGKRIENRKQNVSYRGPILLHASLSEYKGGADWIRKHLGIECPPFADLPKGGIVGRARIVGVLAPQHTPPLDDRLIYGPGLDARWHMRDQYGFVLEDVERLPFAPCKGMLGLFDVDESLLKGGA